MWIYPIVLLVATQEKQMVLGKLDAYPYLED
jgi:hypothetical protein